MTLKGRENVGFWILTEFDWNVEHKKGGPSVSMTAAGSTTPWHGSVSEQKVISPLWYPPGYQQLSRDISFIQTVSYSCGQNGLVSLFLRFETRASRLKWRAIRRSPLQKRMKWVFRFSVDCHICISHHAIQWCDCESLVLQFFWSRSQTLATVGGSTVIEEYREILTQFKTL